MRDDEVRGAAALARLLLRGTTTRIAELHAGISGRAFDAIGPAASGVRTVHDVVSTAAYAGVRFGLGAGARAAGAIAALWADDEPPAAARSRVDRTLGILNGTHGDLVARHAPGLAVRMAVRSEGRDVPLTPEGLAAAFPGASGRLAVFLHGLTETETAWGYRSERTHGQPGVTYGSLLAADLGLTPVYLRYATGLHVSDNGRALDALLGELVAAWPVPVEDVVLVGHSMGGLVARSALHQAGGGTPEQSPWAALVRDTVTLGTPHLGAPLERGVHALTARMARLPETRPLAAVLNSRSVGIKDLRRGTLVEADWTGRDLDAPGTAEHTAVPLSDGARHFVVVATVARNPQGPVAALLGDLMVSARSAQGDTGDDDRLAFPPDAVALVGGLHHLDLLNSPRVYERIREWLLSRPPTDPTAPPRPPAPTRRAAGPSA